MTLACACALIANTAPAASPTPSASQKEVALVFIGDSHTANGILAKEAHDDLAKSVPCTPNYQVSAFGGKTARNLIDLLGAGTFKLEPAADKLNVAVVMAGTNSYNIDDLKELVSLVQSKGYSVVVLTTPPRRGPDIKTGAGGPGSNQAYNGQIRQTFPAIAPGKLQDVQLIDIIPPLLDPDISVRMGDWTAPKFNGDNVHLNKEGYQEIGKQVAEKLRSALVAGGQE